MVPSILLPSGGWDALGGWQVDNQVKVVGVFYL